VVYRTLDSDGLGSEADVAAAMIRAADAGAKVISLSLGMQAVDDDTRCPALEAVVEQILSRPDPPAIVASAGNNGTTEKVYPAALDEVVSVAALQAGWTGDPAQTPGAGWSSYGDWVTCSTVGEGIVSTFVKGTEDPLFGGTDVYPDDSWAVWSGTSFAAPQVAGHISRKCRDEGIAPRAAVAALFPTGNRPADGYGTRVVLLEGTQPSP